MADLSPERLPLVYRFDLASDEELRALSEATLPLATRAGAPRRTMHRDLYIDTSDDTLQRHGILCRLRLHATGGRVLSLRMTGTGGAPVRVDARVRSADVTGALTENNAVTRCLGGLIDPDALAVCLELEVARTSRVVGRDLLWRPRIELHYDRVTVRREGATRTFHELCCHLRRGSAAELARLVRALQGAHDLQPAGDRRERGELVRQWMRGDSNGSALADSDQMHRAVMSPNDGVATLLCPELSLLAFQRRVLALAEESDTPLRERLRFLGIVTSNLDELYMVRMAELRRAAEDGSPERGDDGLTAAERLAAVEREITAILGAQARCAAECLRAAEGEGTRVVRWSELVEHERAALEARCRDEIRPGLTPMAMTLSPGHPIPHLPHLGLSLAVVLRDEAGGGRPRLAELELPGDVPRLVPVPGRARDVIAIEEVLREGSSLSALYPHSRVASAHLFRVTRGGALELHEAAADDLLVAVEAAAERRSDNPAVRVEVEHSMPAFVRELVLESLRREATVRFGESSTVNAVQVMDGLLDLRCLGQLPLPDDERLEYPPLRAHSPVAGDRRMLDVVRDGDLLVHHPFESFDASVVRFLEEASADPDVTAIKITLYRVGETSRIVDALRRAAEGGKRVAALVELKARFDEEHNVSWTRALEEAGGHVVYGLVGLKVHAKVALVVRREGVRLRRYAHVGTGNYSARSGRQYTDLSLFSASDAVTSDVADLFNELTGSSQPPQGLRRGSLAAPHQLLPAVLKLIEREIANARAGLASGIAIKVNGLSDPEVVRALYRASSAGVRVDLVVRGICTLRPGVPGLSDRIRIVSVVGRFLEHSRIYRFTNGGDAEYFIGSSDLRPRNLRRRVELLVPVTDAGQRSRLERLLALYLDDSTAWELDRSGVYARRAGGSPGAQEILAAECDALAGHGAGAERQDGGVTTR